jgi:hypothetical protein
MSAGLEVADVFRRHGDAYRRAHDGHLSRIERRVMSAIALCRTAALGGHTEACAECGLVCCAYNSCRNRHCPKCQGQARSEWLAARQAELLPVPYFHVVFTLPAPAAEIAFHNKATVYAILFRTAAETLRTIAAEPKHLGAEIGFLAVLHTWGQNLHHHPHVHCVVPGGGLSLDHTRWVACRPGFFLPVRVPAASANCAGSSGWSMPSLHTLPDGFHRIRHYGFLANRQRAAKLALCRRLLDAPSPEPPAEQVRDAVPSHRPDRCPTCGGAMVMLGVLARSASCRTSFWDDTS